MRKYSKRKLLYPTMGAFSPYRWASCGDRLEGRLGKWRQWRGDQDWGWNIECLEQMHREQLCKSQCSNEGKKSDENRKNLMALVSGLEGSLVPLQDAQDHAFPFYRWSPRSWISRFNRRVRTNSSESRFFLFLSVPLLLCGLLEEPLKTLKSLNKDGVDSTLVRTLVQKFPENSSFGPLLTIDILQRPFPGSVPVGDAGSHVPQQQCRLCSFLWGVVQS